MGEELVKATCFRQVATLLADQLRAQIGAKEILLFDFSTDLSFATVMGEGPVAQELRKDPEGIRQWMQGHAKRAPEDPTDLTVGPSGEALAALPDVAEWLKSIGCSDIAGGMIMSGKYRSASIAALREGRPFDAEERERLDVTVLLCRSVLARLLRDSYERRVLERLMYRRKETANAVFILRDNYVIPYNPGAVSYADDYWEKDEIEHAVSADILENLRAAITGAWTSPVEAQWIDFDLDLGAGETPVGVIAHPDGGVLLLFSPPPRQATVNAVPMLTRRQCDIMDWIAEGKTSAEVAIILEISPRTVEKHLEAVFQRFGVENRVAAVRTYLEAKGGLLPGYSPS